MRIRVASAARIRAALLRAATLALFASAGIGVATLSGCGGGGGGSSSDTPPAPVFAALVAPTTDAPPLTACPYGGISLDSGIDRNGNGALDPSEVTGTQYVCNGATGATGAATLLLVSGEPVGAHCAAGGVKVQAGQDANGNAVLDAGEVTSTGYVCSGADGSTGPRGADGAAGLNALVSVTTEPAGANCTFGGKKMQSGLDANANGVLDSTEVRDTSYVCNGSPGAGVSWVNVVGTSQQAAANTGYLANNADLVTITLPAAPALGDLVQVSGAGAGGWKIAQNAGQAIVTGNLGPSGNYGVNWVPRGSAGNWESAASSADGSVLLAGSDNAPIYVSTDHGATWTPRGPVDNWYGLASSADGRVLAASSGGGIYVSTDFGMTWTQRSTIGAFRLASSADGSKLVAAGVDGWLHTSADSGVTWTQRGSFAAPPATWASVASSADGTKLVAVARNGQIHTSTDSGVTWTARESNRVWCSVASSADGSKLVAAAIGDQLYTSTDSGVTWTPRDAARQWSVVASSADGSKLAAVGTNEQIYTSMDFGMTWTPRETVRRWEALAMSADGGDLLAGVYVGGQMYTSSPTTMASTTPGTTGYLAGDQYDAATLQYVGNGKFMVTSFAGRLFTY